MGVLTTSSWPPVLAVGSAMGEARGRLGGVLDAGDSKRQTLASCIKHKPEATVIQTLPARG